MTEATQRTSDNGVSIWLDDLSRSRIESGSLQDLIANKNVVGVTTNPSIFQKALSQVGPTRILGELLLEEFVSQASVGHSGLALQSLGLVGAVGFQQLVDSGVHAGHEEGSDGADVLQVVAVGGSLSDALDVSVDDLLVALEREDQGDVHGDTLGQGGGDGRQAFEGCRNLDHGVRSVDLLPEFHSLLGGVLGVVGQTRVDLDGDAAVDEVGSLSDLAEDVGGVAHVGGGELADSGLNVNLAELLELSVVRADLAAKGAKVQRPLWASTGTKNAAYSDCKYVDELVAKHIVNTMPEKTLNALADHGNGAPSIEGTYEESHAIINKLAELGINLKDVTDKLEADGVAAFIKSWDSVLSDVQSGIDRVNA